MGLAQSDQTGIRSAAQHFGVPRRDAVFEKRGARFRRHARRIKQVFPRHRYPVEKPATHTALRPFICGLCLGHCARFHEAGIDTVGKRMRFRRVQKGRRHIARVNIARSDGPPQIAHAHLRIIDHHLALLYVLAAT